MCSKESSRLLPFEMKKNEENLSKILKSLGKTIQIDKISCDLYMLV